MGDCAGFEHAFSYTVAQFWGSILSTAIVCIALLIYDWRMGLALLWVAPVSFAIVLLSRKLQVKLGKKHMNAKLTLAEGIQECLETVQDIEACNLEEQYLKKLDAQKPVIVCGDMNVAHQEIDLKNPKTNVNNAGFTPQERGAMTKLLDSGFVDTFRYLYPDATGRYSWWSYMFNARANNAGWRIDYFLVSDRIKDKITDARIDDAVLGSDHCPVLLEIDL